MPVRSRGDAGQRRVRRKDGAKTKDNWVRAAARWEIWMWSRTEEKREMAPCLLYVRACVDSDRSGRERGLQVPPAATRLISRGHTPTWSDHRQCIFLSESGREVWSALAAERRQPHQTLAETSHVVDHASGPSNSLSSTCSLFNLGYSYMVYRLRLRISVDLGTLKGR